MTHSQAHPIGRLFEGPLDIVGDVHGEMPALLHLLEHLGYDAAGSHPDRRRLVFVGDLADRGLDSPAVFAFVQRLVESGRAQCVLGNHELNLLRKSKKEGNGWFFDEHKDHSHELLGKAPRASASQRESIERFLDTLPVALERDDLRVVHACWHGPSIEALMKAGHHVMAAYSHFEGLTREHLNASGISARAADEEKRFEAQIEDPKWDVPFLSGLAESDEVYQMGNPIRVLTSGIERRTDKPFYAGGKWRFVERAPWWDDYDEKHVAIGHYWRWRDPQHREGKAGPDLFRGVESNAWLGPAKKVFCVDFSVGNRYKERSKPPQEHRARLAALRWPERGLVFDDGKTLASH